MELCIQSLFIQAILCFMHNFCYKLLCCEILALTLLSYLRFTLEAGASLAWVLSLIMRASFCFASSSGCSWTRSLLINMNDNLLIVVTFIAGFNNFRVDLFNSSNTVEMVYSLTFCSSFNVFDHLIAYEQISVRTK